MSASSARTDIFFAYIPALHISVLSRRKKDFIEKIEAEILSALRRDGWLKSLQYLRWLERIKSVSLDRIELSVTLPTAKQRAIAEEKDEQEEKNILEETGEDLTLSNLKPAYQREKEVGSMAKREGLTEKNLKIACSKAVVKFLAEKGFDKRFGARPLQRTIETLLTAPLAEFLLQNPPLKNAEILVEKNGEKLEFSVK